MPEPFTRIFPATADFVQNALDKARGTSQISRYAAELGNRRGNFYGNTLAAAVPALATDEPSAKIPRLAETIAAQIEDGITGTDTRAKWQHAEDGETLDPARLLDFMTGNGDARFFTRRRRQPRPAKLATIIFAACLPCTAPLTDFEKRGATAAAAVSALERRGYSTALWIENAVETRRPCREVASYYPAKRHGEPLDLSAVWYATRPEVTRRIGHMDLQDLHAVTGSDFDSASGRCHAIGATAACAALGLDPAQTIYIPFTASPREMQAEIISGISRIIRHATAA